MRIVAKRYVFQGLFEKAYAVTARSNAAEVMRNIRLEASPSEIIATGSDSEITMVTRTQQVTVETPGIALLPPKLFDVIKVCPDTEITIEVLEGTAKVSAGGSEWEVKLENHDEYPDIDLSHSPKVMISKEKFKEGLERVLKSVSSENIRSMFLFIQITDDKMRATDGSRYHQVGFPYQVEALFPKRAADELLKRLRGMALDEVSFGETDRQFTFRLDEDLLVATKHTTEYPDVERNILVPANENDLELHVDRRALLEAVKQVAVTADEDTRFLTISLGSNKARFSTLDKFGQTGRAQIEIHWPHQDVEVGVNFEHFMDILLSMKSPQIRMYLGETKNAKRPKPIRFEEDGFVAVLMQLRKDLGEAAKGSDRIRPAQSEPIGWGIHGSHASANGGPQVARPSRTQQATEVIASDISAEDLESAIENI